MIQFYVFIKQNGGKDYETSYIVCHASCHSSGGLIQLHEKCSHSSELKRREYDNLTNDQINDYRPSWV